MVTRVDIMRFHSSRLQFTRDAALLAVAGTDEVVLVEPRGRIRRRIPVPDVQAIAAFADQIWVATGRGILQRFATDGRRLDEQALPIGSCGTLVPTTIGGPAALWTGHEPMMLLDDLGLLVRARVSTDAAIPIAGRRVAHHAGPRLTLPAGTVVALADGAQVAGGSVILDGTSLAVVAEHPRGRDVVVLALASGRVIQRIALPPGMVRVAARRGLAVVHDANHRLTLLDLRFARAVGSVVVDDELSDVAVDPDGKLLAIRLNSGELELAPIGSGASVRLSASCETARHRDLEPPVEVGELAQLDGSQSQSTDRPHLCCPSRPHPARLSCPHPARPTRPHWPARPSRRGRLDPTSRSGRSRRVPSRSGRRFPACRLPRRLPHGARRPRRTPLPRWHPSWSMRWSRDPAAGECRERGRCSSSIARPGR